jgi:glycosyltransferase involved in cell wall biosynthesis
MRGDIPVTVIITTLNEAKNLPRCLAALSRFNEVIVVDSNSTDDTAVIAQSFGASVISYSWNGQYPKKRQWCLDTLPLKNDLVFFVDADEVVPDALVNEIAALDHHCAGYFVDGLYMAEGRPLKFGMRNRKLCLLDRRYIEFPVVDDLNIPGMGEIEGHYQPVLKKDARTTAVRRLRNGLYHYAFEDDDKWQRRHDGYAQWEEGMAQNFAWPGETSQVRKMMKAIFRRAPFKPTLFLAYYYFIKGGFLEGVRNYKLTARKAAYYKRSNI